MNADRDINLTDLAAGYSVLNNLPPDTDPDLRQSAQAGAERIVRLVLDMLPGA